MKPYKEDLTGKKFYRLTVLQFVGKKEDVNDTNTMRSYWVCRCDCGNTLEIRGDVLKRGRKRSCGCYRAGDQGGRKKTHAMTETRQYKIWAAMKIRCDIPENQAYPDYGGRGISYDGRWRSFENFWEDMANGYSKELTLERVDVNLNYSKENCRWASQEEQCRNKRKMKNNTSGVTGVFQDKRANSWKAGWSNQEGKYRYKGFPIKCYGEELSFFMACEYREQMINLLEFQKIFYGIGHGK